MLGLRLLLIGLTATLVFVAASLGLAQVVEPTDEQAGRYDQMAASYLLSDAAGKQQWLEDLLLHRADPACSSYMTADELERQRARQRAILSRAAGGAELSGEGVRRLLAEVDAQEQRAIAKLSRDYQFATAKAFHENRAEFDKWSEAWNRIDSRWHDEGQPLAWQPKLIDWLRRSTESQRQAAMLARRPAPAMRPIPPRTGPAIQQSELEARIAGYNLKLSQLISKLHTQSTWTAEELGHAAEELGDLATARHDLALYWKLLPQSTRRRMPALSPLDGAISLLASRTSVRRRQLEASANEPDGRAQWELRRLDDVSRRLATLAAART